MNESHIVNRNGVFRVYCPKKEDFSDAKDCEDCYKFIKIDPVTSIIKCKG